MKKNLKTLNFIIVFTIIFSTCVFIENETGFVRPVFANSVVAAQSAGAAAQNPTELNAPVVEQQKNVYSPAATNKSGFKYMLVKFFSAMFGVLVSALAIFAGLKLYKKFILKNNIGGANINFNKTLESPRDFKEAINLFLDKTDK